MAHSPLICPLRIRPGTAGDPQSPVQRSHSPSVSHPSQHLKSHPLPHVFFKTQKNRFFMGKPFSQYCKDTKWHRDLRIKISALWGFTLGSLGESCFLCMSLLLLILLWLCPVSMRPVSILLQIPLTPISSFEHCDSNSMNYEWSSKLATYHFQSLASAAHCLTVQVTWSHLHFTTISFGDNRHLHWSCVAFTSTPFSLLAV
jgi:hypothetical protein